MNERDNQSSTAASAGRSPNAQCSMFNAQFLRSGQGVPLPERLSLRAGPLSLTCEVGDLRYLKLGGREVIRRIYAAVRDRNWGTVPAVISDFQSQIAADHFHIRYTSTHRQGESRVIL